MRYQPNTSNNRQYKQESEIYTECFWYKNAPGSIVQIEEHFTKYSKRPL